MGAGAGSQRVRWKLRGPRGSAAVVWPSHQQRVPRGHGDGAVLSAGLSDGGGHAGGGRGG